MMHSRSCGKLHRENASFMLVVCKFYLAPATFMSRSSAHICIRDRKSKSWGWDEKAHFPSAGDRKYSASYATFFCLGLNHRILARIVNRRYQYVPSFAINLSTWYLNEHWSDFRHYHPPPATRPFDCGVQVVMVSELQVFWWILWAWCQNIISRNKLTRGRDIDTKLFITVMWYCAYLKKSVT